MRKLIFVTLLLVFWCLTSVTAQVVSYSYDSNGNRTDRTITLKTMAALPQGAEEQSVKNSKPEENPEFAAGEPAVYPNPVNTVLYFTPSFAKSQSAYKVFIYSIDGSTIFSNLNVVDKIEVDAASLKPGLYILKAFQDKQVYEWKIVKE